MKSLDLNYRQINTFYHYNYNLRGVKLKLRDSIRLVADKVLIFYNNYNIFLYSIEVRNCVLK